ncbi:hypothetical protein PVK06_028251 [Gossypium arboreum]|uniref:Uncharacterized protein n=1 Tax=Gossypium arboreum TaxID=29729 RepID=A0ABR0P2G1_GOSAR|nr:hypothetical protein PVK06_028251 [Gossypium arboreum]
MSMFYVGNTYTSMPLSFICWQSASSFDYNIGFIRTDDVLPTTYTGKGTFIIGHSTKVDNEEKAGNKEGEGGKNKETEEGAKNEEGSKTNDDPIWVFGPDDLKIELFSEPKVSPIEPEGSGSNGESSNNVERTHPNFTTFAPLPYMLNVNLDAEGELEFP